MNVLNPLEARKLHFNVKNPPERLKKFPLNEYMQFTHTLSFSCNNKNKNFSSEFYKLEKE